MKTQQIRLIFITLSFFALSACNALGGAKLPAADAKTSLTDATTAPIEPTEIPPTPMPHFLSGLVYADGAMLYQMDTAGAVAQLSGCARGNALSADGTKMLYGEVEDIWVVDLGSCATTNLTHSPESWELNPQWWLAQGNKIIFGANPEFNGGKPTSMNADGSEYRVLDEKGTPNYPAALSPKNSYLAYLASDGPLIFNITDGARIPFDVNYYGLDSALVQRMDSPAWSPDGTKLAWIATTQNGDDFESWRMNVIVFDLSTLAHTIVYAYVPVGRGGWPPPPVWSPDGQWLALNPWVESPLNDYAMWVIKADGSESHLLRPSDANPEQMLDQAAPPVWRPDSQMLAFTLYGEPAGQYYVNVGEWVVMPLSVPSTGVLLAWW